MNKIKNIITINDFNYSQGGASKVAIDTANSAFIHGYNSVFISAVSNDDRSTLLDGVIQYKYNGIEFLNYGNKLKGMYEGISNKEFSNFIDSILDRFNYNDTVIHIHGWTKACSSEFFNVLQKKRFKVFLTLHEYFSFCPNGAYFNYKKNSPCDKKGCSLSCLLSNCDSRNYIFKLYRFVRQLKYNSDIDFGNIHIIYISRFEKNLINRQINVSKEKVIENPIPQLKSYKDKNKLYDFVFIGRTSEEKGINLFISLAKEFPEKKFLLVGDYSCDLNNLFITGWVSENKVDDYLLSSKVLIFPSLWPETFGLNVVKALAYGVFCIVSSNTAAENYIINGKNGYVFKQGNLADLILKVKMYYVNECNRIARTSSSEQKIEYFDELINYYYS